MRGYLEVNYGYEKSTKEIAYAKSDDRQKALDNTLAHLEKTFGKGAIMRLGDNANMNVEAISTGSLSLDMALGIGGISRAGVLLRFVGRSPPVRRRLPCMSWPPAQRSGGDAAFIDAEHALGPVYAQALGVNIDELLVSQPDNGEQALEIAEALVRSGAIDVIVIDSVAALVPRARRSRARWATALSAYRRG